MIPHEENGVYYFYVGKDQETCMIDSRDKHFVNKPIAVSQGNLQNCATKRLIHSEMMGTAGRGEWVKHKNGNKLDLTRSNLILVREKGRKFKKKLNLKHGIQRKTIITKGKEYRYWSSQVGRNAKLFSIGKHGDKEAAEMAIAWRFKKAEELGFEMAEPQGDFDAWGNRTEGEFYGN
jgi:hypothetical protein